MSSGAIPHCWLPRPPFELVSELEAKFETLYAQQVAPATGGLIEEIPAPKWVFLSWLVDTKPTLLHGSGNSDITLFEPRSPNDDSPDDFSKQKAVFAAGDGIWPVFYAVMDRENYRFRMLNSASQFETSPGHYTGTQYFFSITEGVLSRKPWRDGSVYILPRHGFVQQPPYELAGRRVLEPHFANPGPVKPLAKLSVAPADFPFLGAIREHDEATVRARAARDPYGFPWLG